MSATNRFVDARYLENVQRLALGVEPIDQASGGRVPHVVQAALDAVPQPPTTLYNLQPWEWLGGRLPRFPRHQSCHYAIVYKPGFRTPVDLRLFDTVRRFVPRRLRVTVPTEGDVMAPEVNPNRPPVPLASRVVRPLMYPGAAYNCGESSTGLRGRVVRNQQPMRWARVEARLHETGEVVGRAHGDDRGDFLLLIRGRGSQATPPTDPLHIDIRVYGPAVAPAETYPFEAEVDDLWDLPRETPAVPVPAGGDPIADGIQPPPGYQASTTGDIAVNLPLGRLSSAGLSAFAFTT
jgi:hypothetical protein